jgi:hypothetical protein
VQEEQGHEQGHGLGRYQGQWIWSQGRGGIGSDGDITSSDIFGQPTVATAINAYIVAATTTKATPCRWKYGQHLVLHPTSPNHNNLFSSCVLS